MKTKYILSVGGRIGMVQLNIMVDGSTDANAIELAKMMAGPLATAGYHDFQLFNVEPDDHVRICRLRVEVAAPTVTVG